MGEVRWWFFFRVMDVGAKKEIEKRDCKFDSKGRIKFRETSEELQNSLQRLFAVDPRHSSNWNCN